MKMPLLVSGPALALCIATLTACPGDDGSATTTTDGDTTGTTGSVMPTVTSPTVTVGMTMGMDSTTTMGATTMEMTTAVDTTEGTTAGTTEGTTAGTTEGTTGESTGASTGSTGSTGGSTSTGMAMDCTVLGCTPDEELCNATTGLCESLYACDAFNPELDRINLSTYAQLGTAVISDAGGIEMVGGCNGLATDPVSGDMYIVANDGGGGNRRLGIIDPSTGAVTFIGALSDAIAGIAFDDTGGLYGLTGQFGALTPNAVYSIDTGTAVMMLVVDVADVPMNNLDGEALAFSPTAGLAFRWSGNGDPKHFASIDLGTMIETAIPATLVPTGEVLAGVFVPAGPLADRLLISTRDNEAISVQTDGTYTNEGAFGGPTDYYKGLAFSAN